MKTKKPRKTRANPNVYHTIAALAGALDVPVAVVRQAKKAGATGFRSNGNVDLLSFTKWLLTKGQDFLPQMDLESARAQLAQARAAEIIRNGKVHSETMAPIEDLAKTLWFAVYLWSTSIPGLVDELSPHLRRGDADRGPEYYALRTALDGALRNALLSTVAAASAPMAQLPNWAIEAFRKGAETLFPDDGDADFQARRNFFAKVLSVNAGQSLEEQIAHIKAK